MFKFWIMILIGCMAFAAKAQKLDLYQICGGAATKSSMKIANIDNQNYVIVDRGFCAEFLSDKEFSYPNLMELKNQIERIDKKDLMTGLTCDEDSIHSTPQLRSLNKKNDKWKVRFYASHSWTTYFNTDLKINSSRYQIEIKDFEWAERSSREFFEWSTMTAPGNNPAQIIDEPTNTFVVSIEKNGVEFFLSAFHPKFLQAKDQVKHITGTVDSVKIDRVQEVNQKFVDYSNIPGETKIVDNRSTHKQMSFEIGASKRFVLFSSNLGSVVYVPSIGIGLMVGETYTVAVKEGQWWDLESATDKYGVQGFGGSGTNRIEINSKNEKFGVFYENKLSTYKMDHGFLDGTQKYNLRYMGNSAGLKFMLWNKQNHKKKVEEAKLVFE